MSWSDPDDAADDADAGGCQDRPGRFVPIVDRDRCEAEADCVQVCPYSVFEVRKLEPPDRAALSLRGRLKAWAHGGRQAYTVRAGDCHACGKCVTACPEGAISLAQG